MVADLVRCEEEAKVDASPFPFACVTDGIRSINPCYTCLWRVYQGVVLDIFHIYVVSYRGRQPLRGVSVTP
jgi:hypothetical protein